MVGFLTKGCSNLSELNIMKRNSTIRNNRSEYRNDNKIKRLQYRRELMFQIDINCDLGESFGAYKIGLDEEILDYVTSANIACGFHAGDPSVMRKTVALAAEKA